MNAPAPGWNPDPTGRHEYRYWDGGRWTDDVSDNGVSGTDAIGGPVPPGGDATATMDPTSQFGQPPGPHAPGPDAPTATGPYAPGAAPSGPYGPQYGSGGPSGQGFPPATPPKSGPKTGLIVGIAAAAVALIAVVVVIAMQGGDDKTDTKDVASKSEQTTTTADSGVTLPPTTAGSDTTVTGNDGDGKISGVDEDVIKSAMTTAFEKEGMTHEQADCASNAMIDQFGDRLADIGASSNPLSQLTSDDMSKLFGALSDCGIDPSTLGGG
jgi:Protein of unknown function (DUF2510)